MAVAISGMVKVVKNFQLLKRIVAFPQMVHFFPRDSQCCTLVHTTLLPPVLADVLTNFLKEVAAAAPGLPFYYYHIPALTGVKSKCCFFDVSFPLPLTSYPISLRNCHSIPCHKHITTLLTRQFLLLQNKSLIKKSQLLSIIDTSL